MTEPGTPAPDLAALFDEARRIQEWVKSRRDEMQKWLDVIEAFTEEQKSEPKPNTRRPRGKARRPPPWISNIASVVKDIKEERYMLEAFGDRLITTLSRASQEPPRTRQDGSAVAHDALGQGRRDPGREEVRQGGTPADTAEGGSHEQAVLASTESRAASKPSTQIIAATNPEAISDAAQQQDSSTAKQDGNAAAQGASTHQRRDAKDQAPANAHGDNSATSIEASRDTSSDGSNEDTPMRDYDEVQPSPPGSTATADTLMTDAEQPTCGQDLAKRAAEATTVMSPQAHEGEGGPEPIVANDQAAESLGPEDRTGRPSKPDGHTATPLPAAQDPASRCASPNDSASNREDTASAQTSTPTPSSGTTPQDRTTQPPATPNPSSQDGDAHLNVQDKSHGTTPQGSDTTEDTSRATTPDTHLTSPDTSVSDSPPQLTLSKADMGERLVEALGRIINRDDTMHKISVPNLPIDLDLIKAAVKAELSAPNPDWQFTANRFVPGPKGEGYMRAYISKRRSHFAFPDFPDKVVIPTKEEARKWLDDYFDNPPEGIVPYFTGHLDLPYGDLLNPGATILDNRKLLDLHRPYWHIGGDKSANRFHIEDYNCSEDESPCGLRSANLVLEGVKLWTAIETHHTKKFEAFVAKNWDCNGCSQRVGHQSLLISPLTLEREGIDFEIKVQGPGDLMIPGRSQYHMVVNMGFNIAMSMNHLQRGDRLKSTALRQCVKCGVLDDTVTRVPPPKSSKAIQTPPPIPDTPPGQSEAGSPLVSSRDPPPKSSESIRRPLPSILDPPPEQSEAQTLLGKRPRADHQGTQTSGRGKRACTAARRKLNALKEKIRKWDPDCRIPQVPGDSDSAPPEDAFKAAASVQSSLAVRQFTLLVGEWRRRDKDVFLSSGTGHTVLQHGKRLVDLVGKSSLADFLYRHAQACVARQLDLQVKKRGSMRRSKEDTEQLAQQLGMKIEELKAHLEEGRIWNSICGPEDDGLLPFIIAGLKGPFEEEDTLIVKEKCPLHIKKKEWRSLAGKPQAFLKLLDVGYVKNLRQAGRAFEKMVLTGSKQVFRWEKEGLDTQTDGWESLLCQVDDVAD
ncbi:JmjC domain-containing protein [Fusarium falciforme]|uniref:JmjC domain-containing protein n=1 Tax=Fusarium falciforme TaxID=195108 RepID=UPI0023007188|nr:JmjC domain-containing protein [Fusarium falciforme]WAO96047.1 JmjC domain-containing protein [Fusarium falciforme]